MKTDRLLHAFSMIGEDPARIQQLRQIAVALAIAGKLSTDSAVLCPLEMMRAVEQVKTDLFKQRAIPKPKNLKPIEQDELPEGFPDARRFAPLGRLARVEKGLTGIKQAQPGPFPLVVTGAERANCDHFDFEGAAAIIPLVSSTGHGHASLNRLHYQEGKFALGTILAAVFPYEPALVSARFIFEYLSGFKEELLVTRMTGTANVTLSIGSIAEVPVPLIDPAIQAKVDELMALLDRLEAARAAREATRDRLAAASLARLTAPDTDPAEFPANVRFALATLPALTTRPNQIKPLRQTILNLAVRGKLVAQHATDEPASELLKRVADEKAALIHRKEIRRKREISPVDRANEPFPIPTSWEWCRLGNLFHLVTDGAHHTPRYIDDGVPFLSVKDVSSGKISFEDVRYISEEQHDELCKRCRPERGDILLTKVGTTGIAVPVDTDRSFSIFVSVALLKFSQENLAQAYLTHLINSPFVRQQSADGTQGIGNQNLVLRTINEFALPIPPLAEQHRIVAKVDALMALCDRLEAALITADTTRARLLEALLHEALTPAERLEMEAAQ